MAGHCLALLDIDSVPMKTPRKCRGGADGQRCWQAVGQPIIQSASLNATNESSTRSFKTHPHPRSILVTTTMPWQHREPAKRPRTNEKNGEPLLQQLADSLINLSQHHHHGENGLSTSSATVTTDDQGAPGIIKAGVSPKTRCVSLCMNRDRAFVLPLAKSFMMP